jgi:hypothetical protein
LRAIAARISSATSMSCAGESNAAQQSLDEGLQSAVPVVCPD